MHAEYARTAALPSAERMPPPTLEARRLRGGGGHGRRPRLPSFAVPPTGKAVRWPVWVWSAQPKAVRWPVWVWSAQPEAVRWPVWVAATGNDG